MALRYLFGPVDKTFADDNLAGPRQAGLCLTFGPDKNAEIRIRGGDSWEDVQQRLPAGWQPDLLVLWLAYNTIPQGLWAAPLPRLGLARDGRLLWHYYRTRLPACDLVWTDAPGAELFQRAGLAHVRPAILTGCGRSFVVSPPDEVRDIDILLAGNLNPAVQRERLPWLPRLAKLGQRWRVAIRSGVPAESYRRLLARTRIVFQYSASGKCGRRSFEAAAAGALVFQEAGNRELPQFFRDRQECVYYRPEDVEGLLEHYLEHEDERRQLAEAARQRAGQCRFEDLWQGLMDQLEGEWPMAQLGQRLWRQDFDLAEASTQHDGNRAATTTKDAVLTEAEVADLWARCWQAYIGGGLAQDRLLIADLEKALPAQPQPALYHNAIGALLSRQAHGSSAAVAAAEVAAEHFRQAWNAQPDFALAGLNQAEALEAAGQRLTALEAARRALEQLQTRPRLDDASRQGLLFARPFDHFAMEWERAAWANAGAPEAEATAKRTLLLWRLFALLGQWTGELPNYYEAALLRPDLGPVRAALGKALALDGRPGEALAHLQQALAQAPLDRDTARAACQAWTTLGQRAGRQQLAEERRLLSQAAPTLLPAEPWHSEPRPTGNELASILILCCNQLDYTRQCLDSLWRHTRAPYEVILVNNGSTDGTAAYLEEMRRRPGPARVTIIANDTNLGFARGCNQALAQARGRYVALLNNDTVLVPGWLDGLVSACLHDWPSIGLVGPVTNGAPDAQFVRPGYENLDGLEPFAASRRQAFDGKLLFVKRLTGFCLLIRRDVLERIGTLDERFEQGYCEDDDLCIRAREAGFRLAIAQAVYIHHFGGRTFQGLGFDDRAMLETNLERLRAKWGPEYTAALHLPPLPSKASQEAATAADEPAPEVETPLALAEATPAELPADGTGALPPQEEPVVVAAEGNGRFIAVGDGVVPTSVCMIVRNEEHHLPGCLESIQPLVARGILGEVVIADTGSTDRTREIARAFGARVVEFPWVDSFSAARNESLRHARGKWCLWLDADDRLSPEELPKLEKLIAGLGDERDAYALKVRSVLDASGKTFRLLDQVRLFRILPGTLWDYRIHEQILPAVNRSRGGVRWAGVIIDHVGYQDPGARKSKLDRNLRLLELDYADRPDDSFTLFNLGWTLLDLGRQHEALGHLQHALEVTRPTSSTLRKLYHLLAVAHKAVDRCDEALKVCTQGLEQFADDAELLLEQGVLWRDQKDLAAAEECWLQLLEGRKGQYFASEEVGLRGFRTRQLLAEVYRVRERWVEAEVQWRAALKERPDFEPAWVGLGELFLRQARWSDLEYLLEELTRNAVAPGRVGWLRARGQMQRQEWPAARRTLAEVIGLDPGALGPRVLLSQVLLREGRDWAAAERALRDVRALDPHHVEAANNLRLLLRRLGRQRELV